MSPSLDTMRHSCAHIMAAAIQKLWPQAQFGVGPVIDNGFYYDVRIPNHTLTEADLLSIASQMRKLKKKKQRFKKSQLVIDDAIDHMASAKQPFKVELLQLLKTKGHTAVTKETKDNAVLDGGLDSISFYQTGDFVDLCRGPHVEHSGEIGHFELHKLSGAYWRGHDKNPQLQRIYGLCFESIDALNQEIKRLELLKERDHRKIAGQLELYQIDDQVGRGLPMWLPNGMVLRRELEALAQQHERRQGYQEVATPHLAKEALYLTSGHLPYYADDMYKPIDIDEERFYLKPMNCPHHHQLYKHKPKSYRDLPVRLTEWGQVYRYEKSGALNGLMRARGFCMNDAHIYCRFDQVAEEFAKVIELHKTYYDIFDIQDFKMVLCLPDFENSEKYSTDVENWQMTSNIIRQVMTDMNCNFTEEEGEAAFYGPKIDFIIKSAIGTEYTISTSQLDFMAPKRFNLTYRGESGQDEPLLVIHRAPLGTHERFIAFLCEHYGGHFPVWLAPIQACIIPISDRHIEYARAVHQQLFSANVHTATGGLRVDIDTSSERMQKKIRNAQMRKTPYIIIVGDQETANQTLSVRHLNNTSNYTLPKFLELMKHLIENKQPLNTSQ
ncbi:MAG: threonine--tRNA ligase [Pseudomonadota bacterium]|nr:threonine--tRNA ligase [Pseudomonadota bacterium]